MPKVKKPNRKLAVVKRGIPGLFLSSHDQVYAKKMKKIYKSATTFLLLNTLTRKEETDILIIAASAKLKYEAAMKAEDIEVHASASLGKRIDDFSLQDYWCLFITVSSQE